MNKIVWRRLYKQELKLKKVIHPANLAQDPKNKKTFNMHNMLCVMNMDYNGMIRPK